MPQWFLLAALVCAATMFVFAMTYRPGLFWPFARALAPSGPHAMEATALGPDGGSVHTVVRRVQFAMLREVWEQLGPTERLMIGSDLGVRWFVRSTACVSQTLAVGTPEAQVLEQLRAVIPEMIVLDAESMICMHCGCSAYMACGDGCTWASMDPPICSACTTTRRQ